MVDVFGGSGSFNGGRGPRGPMGPQGLPGSIEDLCTWMPKSVIKNLQMNDELGSFFIEDPTKDLKKSGDDRCKYW